MRAAECLEAIHDDVARFEAVLSNPAVFEANAPDMDAEAYIELHESSVRSWARSPTTEHAPSSFCFGHSSSAPLAPTLGPAEPAIDDLRRPFRSLRQQSRLQRPHPASSPGHGQLISELDH